ncbi:hypothetical protein [Streptomyces longispororuber]|uniref:hypothetical protein n=1 Tax=Streptomyces longispororuber TaxID=68230 RepID=UPI00370297DE
MAEDSITAAAPAVHCGNLAPHDAHRAWSADADVCLGYPPGAPGQIWQDADKRIAAEKRPPRLLRIVEVGPTHASCKLCGPEGDFIAERTLRIRLDRLRPSSTGYLYRGMARDAR